MKVVLNTTTFMNKKLSIFLFASSKDILNEVSASIIKLSTKESGVKTLPHLQ